jgi:tRNA-specific 2-thiouridylase
VAAAEPLYVQRIVPQARAVVVGPAPALERQRFTVLHPSWVHQPPPDDEVVQVRVRHRHAGAPARVHPAGDRRITVELTTPVRAVTPGQAAVFYRQDEVLGGGWIG